MERLSVGLEAEGPGRSQLFGEPVGVDRERAELTADRLVLDDRAPAVALDAQLRVVERRVEGCAGDAEVDRLSLGRVGERRAAAGDRERVPVAAGEQVRCQSAREYLCP